ncbi:hypothetical protein HJFPF1_03921 [Paramyrothecium foliicola]|nr:hypothetical protein HJFPF1_03921 [Paramyrothecium foliicola]
MSFIDKVPNELLCHILGFLDPPIDWDQKLRGDPHIIYEETIAEPAKTANCALKNASLVCRAWHEITEPLLFRHVVWTFERQEAPDPTPDERDGVRSDELGFLAFLLSRNLTRVVESLTVVIPFPEHLIRHELVQLWNYGVMPSRSTQHDVGRMRQLADEFFRDGYTTLSGQEAEDELSEWLPWSNNWLWHRLFSHLCLSRITLISSPTILSSLLSGGIGSESSRLKTQTFWIISLATSEPQPSRGLLPAHMPSLDESDPNRGTRCDLFSIRDWDSLLLNEGKSYTTRYWLLHDQGVPPTFVRRIVDSSDPSITRLHKTLRSMAYIAIHPSFTEVAETLYTSLPPVSEFCLQIAHDKPLADEPRLSGHRSYWDFEHESWDINEVIAKAMLGLEHPRGPSLSPGWKAVSRFEWGDVTRRNLGHESLWKGCQNLLCHETEGPWKVQERGVLVRTGVQPGTAHDV